MAHNTLCQTVVTVNIKWLVLNILLFFLKQIMFSIQIPWMNVDPKIILFGKIFAGMKDVCNSQQLQIAYT